MLPTVTIYHHPKCSKSREALEFLEARGVQPVVVDYVQDPPSRSDLWDLVRMLGVAPSSLVRARDFERLDLEPPTDAEGWIELLARHPVLLERPIVVIGSAARIGRPLERVAELLDGAELLQDQPTLPLRKNG